MKLVIPATLHQQRLDVGILKLTQSYSRALIQKWILEGFVSINHQVVQKASHKIVSNDIIEIELPPPKPSHIIPQNLHLNILYEDDYCVAINKPAHLVVHPGAGAPQITLVQGLLYHFPHIHIGHTQRPGIVHRLDKETSGVILVAKTQVSHEAFSLLFKKRLIQKQYTAFCVGTFKQSCFELKTSHQRHPTDRKRFTTKPISNPSASTRLAHSGFEVVHSAHGISELRVFLYTGRTHQIRAHLADIHHPLLQDKLYGGIEACKKLPKSPVTQTIDALDRHALHAQSLQFEHPFLYKKVLIEAPLPPDLKTIHASLETPS